MSDKGFEQFETNSELPGDDGLALRRDKAFARRLDTDLRFEATPEFEAALRARLVDSMAPREGPAFASPVKPTGRHWYSFNFPALKPWQLATIAAMFLTVTVALVVLLVSLSATPPEVASEVTVTPTTTANPAKVAQFYDNQNGKYINASDAASILGYSPKLPDYVPVGYSVEYAGLNDESRNSPPGITAAPSLQVTYNTANSASSPGANPVEIYQAQFVANGPNPHGKGLQFYMSRIHKSKELQIQGSKAYIIEDPNWRLSYMGMGVGGSDPENFNPPSLRNSRGPGPNNAPPRVSFFRFPPNMGMPGGFVDFRSPNPQQASRSLVWFRDDGLVTVIVGADNLSQEELVKIAESVK